VHLIAITPLIALAATIAALDVPIALALSSGLLTFAVVGAMVAGAVGILAGRGWSTPVLVGANLAAAAASAIWFHGGALAGAVAAAVVVPALAPATRRWTRGLPPRRDRGCSSAENRQT
jgi:hypothetical protein